MNIGMIVIKSEPNSLIPLPEEKKVFEWDLDKYDYSEEAFEYINLLVAMNRSFTVNTSEALEYKNKRKEIAGL